MAMSPAEGLLSVLSAPPQKAYAAQSASGASTTIDTTHEESASFHDHLSHVHPESAEPPHPPGQAASSTDQEAAAQKPAKKSAQDPQGSASAHQTERHKGVKKALVVSHHHQQDSVEEPVSVPISMQTLAMDIRSVQLSPSSGQGAWQDIGQHVDDHPGRLLLDPSWEQRSTAVSMKGEQETLQKDATRMAQKRLPELALLGDDQQDLAQHLISPGKVPNDWVEKAVSAGVKQGAWKGHDIAHMQTVSQNRYPGQQPGLPLLNAMFSTGTATPSVGAKASVVARTSLLSAVHTLDRPGSDDIPTIHDPNSVSFQSLITTNHRSDVDTPVLRTRAQGPADWVITPSMLSSGWHTALGQTMLGMIHRQMSEACIQVRPPELGPLMIHLRLSGNDLGASFLCQGDAARDIVQHSFPFLKESLSQSGLHLAQHDAFAAGQESAFQQQQQPRQGSQQQSLFRHMPDMATLASLDEGGAYTWLSGGVDTFV